MKYVTEVLAYKEHKLFEIHSEVPLVVDTTAGLNGQLDVAVGEQVISILLGQVLVDNNGETWAVRIAQSKYNGEGEASQGVN